MNSLEQAAKALLDDLVNDPDSANLAIIAKHLDAFAREATEEKDRAVIELATVLLRLGNKDVEIHKLKEQNHELLKLRPNLERHRSYRRS